MGSNGFDQLKNQLKQMQESVDKTMDEFNGDVPLEKLLTTDFMSCHTSFTDVDNWLKAGGFNFECQDDYDNLDENKMDIYVQSSTDFQSWEEMLESASTEAIEASLGF